MRYEYTPEQLAWRDEVRRFVRRAVTPALRAEMRRAGNEGDGPLERAFHERIFAEFGSGDTAVLESLRD